MQINGLPGLDEAMTPLTEEERASLWQLPEPGIYEMEAFDYHKIDCPSASRLKAMRRSALHMRYMIDNTIESDAMRLGTAIHAAILEPDKFELQYSVMPKFDRRTREGKAAAQEFELDNLGKIIIDREEYDCCQGIRAAIEASPEAQALVNAPGRIESSTFWRDGRTKLLCKGRMDKVIPVGEGYDQPIVLDIKSTRDASREEFASSCAKYGYHLQGAMYLDGLTALTGIPHERFVILAVESQPPHGVAIYELDMESIQYGRETYARLLQEYKQCLETGSWPGYPAELQFLSLPSWA